MNRVLAIVVAVLLAFGAGWWLGGMRTSPEPRAGESNSPQSRTDEIERKVEDLAHLVRRIAASLEAKGALEPYSDDVGRILDLAVDGSPSRGPPDAAVTIVAFSDFQCPYCSAAPPILDRLLKEHPGKVRLVFKHNPLPNHQQALAAHEAAVAAAEQGKFWPMHDLLFSHQDKLDRVSLREYARTLGLNLEQFDDAVGSVEAKELILRDMAEAKRVGVQAVPSFFINGRLLAGSKPYAVFRQIVEEELAR